MLTQHNKDALGCVQEAWELMFNTVDTMHDCTRIATGVVSTLKINPDRMLAGLSADMLATDLAEYLVRKGTWLFTRPKCSSFRAMNDHDMNSD